MNIGTLLQTIAEQNVNYTTSCLVNRKKNSCHIKYTHEISALFFFFFLSSPTTILGSKIIVALRLTNHSTPSGCYQFITVTHIIA